MKKVKTINGVFYSLEKDTIVEVIGDTIFDGTEAFKLTLDQFRKVYGNTFMKMEL